MRQFRAKLSYLFHRKHADREMRREMDAHLALIEEDLIRRGMAPDEARVTAHRSFGGLDQTRERHRDERSFVWLEQLLQDARHARRSLAKSPGFVAVAVLSLAFGIGVNTAIFTLVNGILLKRLPVADPQRIVQVNGKSGEFDAKEFSFPAWRELRGRNDIFSDVIGFSSSPAVLENNGDGQSIDIEMVTGSYFDFFGARPALGRLLNEEDDRVEGAHSVCVLSHHVWQAQFGGDSRVVGRIIHVSGIPLEVVGVAQSGFVGAELQRRYDVWVPTAMRRDIQRASRESRFEVWVRVLGRLAPGISLAQANARLQGANRSMQDALPKARANKDMTYVTDASKGFDTWRKSLSDPLAILMGAVTLVLLVACANLANLLLARTNERRQEFSIKLSLGISRWRLLRQLLLETLALASGGGALAILLANALTQALVNMFNSGDRYRALRVSPDASVFAFTLAACVVTAFVAGLYPAWRASRADAAAGLKGGSAYGVTGGFVRRALILVQVTLAVVLLFGASLFTHSLAKLKTIDLGYDIDRVLTVNLSVRGKAESRPQLAEVLERVRCLPAVESAGYSYPGLLSQNKMSLLAMARETSGGVRNIRPLVMSASPGFFATLRIPLLRGRDFTSADRADSPAVAIVNQGFASNAWPGEDPIGKRFDSWRKDIEVVGVVGNSKYQEILEDPSPTAYMPSEQARWPTGALEVRARGSLAGLVREIRAIVKTSAPDYRVSDASSMEAARDGQISEQRALAFLSSLFGALGNTLALVGIYGLISYAVARRTREVGIRVAVGAQTRDVLWLFTRESLALTSIGVLLGLPLALMLARLAGKMLYHVSPADPWGIVITLALPALGGLVASYFPARKAARIDPVQALRWE